MIYLKGLLFEAQKEQVALQFLSNIIQNSEWSGRVYLAGGAVRDEIMGKPVKDIDIVVTAKDGGIEFANWITKKVGAYKDGANPVIFPRFGTAKFNLRGAQLDGIDLSDVDIESVMTRSEKYSPGSRKPDVLYADLKTDAERRDLTVNSLFKDLTTGKILDLTGRGIEDIKNGVVRTPLNPDITFEDDPLRMLRVVRFATKYQWKVPKSLIQALKKNAPKLKNISKERIQDELNKMLLTDYPDKAIKLMTYTGLMNDVIPEFMATVGVTQNKYHKDDVFHHILEVLKNTPPSLKARLAAIFHDIGKPQTKTVEPDGAVHFYDHEEVGAQIARDALTRLRYPSDVIESVAKLVDTHMRLKDAGPNGDKVSDKALRRFMSDLGGDLNDSLGLLNADNVSHAVASIMPNQIPNIKARMNHIQTQQSVVKPKLPINGNDLLTTFNLKPGPIIKKMLAAVQDAWYENPNITPADAMAVAKTAMETPDVINPMDDLLNQTIENPETKNKILVRTALKYDDSHPVKRLAMDLIKKNS